MYQKRKFDFVSKKSNIQFDYSVQDVTGMTTVPSHNTNTIGKEYIYTIGNNDTIPPSFNSTGLRSLHVLNSMIPGPGQTYHQQQQSLNHNNSSPSHYSIHSNHQVHVQSYDNPAMTHIDIDTGHRTLYGGTGNNVVS